MSSTVQGVPFWVHVLSLAAPVLNLGLLVLLGWLAYRLITGRLGPLGKILLFALAAVAAFSLPWVVGLGFAGRPLEALVWAALFVCGVLLGRTLLKAFPFPFPWRLSFLLTSPLRRFLVPAETVLGRMALGPGMNVLEVGSGPGYLAFDVAARVLPDGRVVCVDVQPQMIARIQEKARRTGVENVEAVVASADLLPLDTQSVQLVYLVTVLGEIGNRQQALAEAYRVLAPGCALSVSEFLIDPHYCSKPEVRKLALRAGFEEHSVEGGLWSYTATFRKPGAYLWRRF